MQSYVDGETGSGSEESTIVERNLAHNRTPPGQARSETYASCFAARRRSRCAPWSARFAAGRSPAHSPHRSPVSVLGEWSAQHLRVITASLVGSVLVIVPSRSLGRAVGIGNPLRRVQRRASTSQRTTRGSRPVGALRSHRRAVRRSRHHADRRAVECGRAPSARARHVRGADARARLAS